MFEYEVGLSDENGFVDYYDFTIDQEMSDLMAGDMAGLLLDRGRLMDKYIN